ncbi:hypothetical protein [Paenibacillus sp. 481]|uniref:hypothetical protein n=1 Tax=Paenibacillus sp. 481 TaxID=2835869 RepID=UPI001E314BA4|nr:hypothetical protein [Paenibacillus sp. 481]UHA75191.1 hypothetical protein KIK04_09285 [Paenibacillus sp. 481]
MMYSTEGGGHRPLYMPVKAGTQKGWKENLMFSHPTFLFWGLIGQPPLYLTTA